MRLASVVALLTLLPTTAGCKREGGPIPICLAEVAEGEAAEASSQELPPDVWFSIMVKNFQRKEGLIPDDARDCSGQRIVDDFPDKNAACTESGPAASALVPDRPLTADDLTVTDGGDGKLLVWARARHYQNGEALGPVALAEWTKRGIAVRAIGSLRAHASRAALRLEPMGADQVLVVQSEACADDDPKSCVPMLRVLPLANGRFIDGPLVGEDGTCLGRVAFELYRTHEVPMPSGLFRTFELTRVARFEDGAVTISEQVTVKDRDPDQPDEPPTLFRQAATERPLRPTEAGFVTTEGLWDKMVAEHGSVRVNADDAAGTASP